MADLYSRDFEKKKLNSATMLRLEQSERDKLDKTADKQSAVSGLSRYTERFMRTARI
jgi:hypothetical protein